MARYTTETDRVTMEVINKKSEWKMTETEVISYLHCSTGQTLKMCITL